MAALANPLPAIVTAEMLGVPTADHEQLKAWSQDFAEMLGNFQHNPGRAAAGAAQRRGDGRPTSAPRSPARRPTRPRVWSTRS